MNMLKNIDPERPLYPSDKMPSDRSSSISSSCNSESSVTFGSIAIREFERIAGDHPDVSDMGPPLSIGWGYYQNDEVTVDDYEYQRDGCRCKPERLEGTLRRNILQYGFMVPVADIDASIKEVYRVQRQREKAKKPKGLFGVFGKTIFHSRK